jgi:hypothetical protein
MDGAAELLNDIRKYLVFTGYEVSEQEAGIYYANHPTQFAFVFGDFKGGVLLYGAIETKPDATEKNPLFMQFINRLNAKAVVARFYDNKGSLVVENWFGGPYDSAMFGRFFDLWKADVALSLEREASTAKKFLE